MLPQQGRQQIGRRRVPTQDFHQREQPRRAQPDPFRGNTYSSDKTGATPRGREVGRLLVGVAAQTGLVRSGPEQVERQDCQVCCHQQPPAQ